jgi:hypothetical protein
MVFAQYFYTRCWGWQKVQQSSTLAFDWLDGLIGLGGLLFLINKLL